jgi:hypothetical protein
MKNLYNELFKRNIGILTNTEQNILKDSTVGIAGLGGLGGQTFINLVRMGIEKFNLADIDSFDLSNTNRQIGASQKTMGKEKVNVMSAMAIDINPAVEITHFHSGIQKENVDAFVGKSDIIVDSLDFFCLTARELLYSSCYEAKKTVILSAPLGFSATLHVFSNTSMPAKDFFSWNEQMDKFEKMVHFAVGIAPKGLHLTYLNFDKDNLVNTGTGPSISFSCGLGAAMLASEILMALLNRRNLFEAPCYTQFDLFHGNLAKGKLHWGNKGPIQKIKIYLAKKQYQEVRDKLNNIIK